MTFYKNWYKKFVQACVALKPKFVDTNFQQGSASSLDNRLDSPAVLQVATELPHSFVHYFLSFTLTSASVFLVFRLRIPMIACVVLLIIVCIIFIYDLQKIIHARNQILYVQCINHEWSLCWSDNTQESVEIVKISQGLGLLYVLNFVSKQSQREISVCIWKYQSNSDFLAYCSQLLLIGKKG